MPESLAWLTAKLPIRPGSRRRSGTSLIDRKQSLGASAGDRRSVARPTQDHLAHSGLIAEPKRRQDAAIRIHGPQQSLALQRQPDRGIAQTARVAGGDDGLAEVEMVAMRVGRPHDDAARFLARARIIRQTGKLL